MIHVVRAALAMQLDRLLKDKESEAFKTAPLFIVLKINDEIYKIQRLLADRSWRIMIEYDD